MQVVRQTLLGDRGRAIDHESEKGTAVLMHEVIYYKLICNLTLIFSETPLGCYSLLP